MILGVFGHVLKIYKDDELVYMSHASNSKADAIFLASKALGLGMNFRDALSLELKLEDVSSKNCVWGSYRFETSYNPYPR